jgi:hypothetical protein
VSGVLKPGKPGGWAMMSVGVEMSAEDKVTAIMNLLRHGQVLGAEELLKQIRRIADKEPDD